MEVNIMGIGQLIIKYFKNYGNDIKALLRNDKEDMEINKIIVIPAKDENMEAINY